jgi:hypothetical protein
MKLVTNPEPYLRHHRRIKTANALLAGGEGHLNLRGTRSVPTEWGKPDALYGWPEDGLWSWRDPAGTLLDALHKSFCNVPEGF